MTEDDFGDFGDVDVKVCNICSKTITRSKCYGYVRARDIPKGYSLSPTTTPYSNPNPTYICVKCLLKGLWTICKGDRSEINKYFDLFVKTSLTENI